MAKWNKQIEINKTIVLNINKIMAEIIETMVE